MSVKIYDKSGATPREVLLAGVPATDLILNGTSKNPIANKAVYNALAEKVEKTVTDLVYYYTTNDVYTKSEVRQLIGAINTLTIEVVAALPSTDISSTTIYFVGPEAGTNNYTEYVYVNNAWVELGDTEIDLSNYVTDSQLTLAIADFLTETEINLLLADKQDKALSSSVTIGGETVGFVEDAIGAVADIVPSDASSSNQLATQADIQNVEIDVDNALSSTSENPVQNKVIKGALDAKQNTLTFDSTPTAGSSNPVTSDGIKDAIDDTATDIYEVMGKNGAKNLFKNEAITTTQHNITFTVYTDDSVRANTSSNTTTVQWSFRLNKFAMKAGTYKLSDGNTGDFSATCWLQLVNEAETTAIAQCTTSHEVEFTLASDQTVILRLFYKEGATFNYLFKPMIRLAEDTASTYQPYAMTNQQMTPYVQAISNPNLLDNPWFTINQRGRTTYSNSMNGFSVDRWYKNLNISLDVIDNGVRLTKKAASNPTLYQKIEASPYLLGKTVTLSVMTTDGKIRSCTGTFPTTFPSSGNTIVVNFDDDVISFRLQAVSTFNPYFIATLDTENCAIDEYLDIRAAKLELGTASTLAMDTAPNYQQELAKCQRYFVRYTSPRFFEAYTYDATTARFGIPLPVPMRDNPVFSVDDITNLQFVCNSKAQALSSSQTIANSGYGTIQKVMQINTLTSGLFTVNHAGVLKLNSGYIDLSADL